MGVEELRQRRPPVARASADESGFSDRVVAHQHTLDQLAPGLHVLVVPHLEQEAQEDRLDREIMPSSSGSRAQPVIPAEVVYE